MTYKKNSADKPHTGREASPKKRRAPFENAPEKETAVDNEQLIFGRNAVRELLHSGRDIDKIFVAKSERDGSLSVLVAEALERRIPLLEIDRRKMDAMCAEGRHQGIAASAAARNYATIDDMLSLALERNEKPFIVIADGIEDPHNLGAIIRSAECAGAHGVLIPKRRASGLTSVAAKASAGALEHIPIARVPNLSAAIKELKEKGLWVYAADMEGTPYYQTDFSTGTAIVLGSEGEGISRLVLENCDAVVSIPMFGQVNSLNVSAAAAVLLFEVARQHHQ